MKEFCLSGNPCITLGIKFLFFSEVLCWYISIYLVKRYTLNYLEIIILRNQSITFSDSFFFVKVSLTIIEIMRKPSFGYISRIRDFDTGH